MPSARAIAASRRASAMFTLSMPGMWAIGTRRCSPSTRKIGQMRSLAVSELSATRRRDQAALRLRRIRTVGKCPAPVSTTVGSRTRCDRALRGASSGLIGHPRPCGERDWVAYCANARRQRKRVPKRGSFADDGHLAFGHVDVKMVLVGVVGFRPEHGAKNLAGGVV